MEIIKAIKCPRLVLAKFWENWVSTYFEDDILYTRVRYYLKTGKTLNLTSPKTYNEKLQWLKLYDRKDIYTTMVDKYAVKNLVFEKTGRQDIIIPTLGVWDKFDDIDFNALPNSFVLKTTMAGGNTGVIICKDKTKFDKVKAKIKLEKSLIDNLYVKTREWPYKNVPKKIIAEQFISPHNGEDLPDYKFFCFNGDVKALFIATERSTGDVKFDYFDANFNHLDLIQIHPMSGKTIEKPSNFEEMKEIASILSKGVPELRVDLYNVDGQIYFGELTFYHHGGVVPFHPSSWDETFGSWIDLSLIK